MAAQFNTPPGWPAPPPGWSPPPGWRPDPSWPEAPPGWQFWGRNRSPRRRAVRVLIGLVVAGVAIAGMAYAGRRMAPTQTDANLHHLVATFGPACAGHAIGEAGAFTGRTPFRVILLSDQGTSSADTERSLPEVWTSDQIELVVCVAPVVEEPMPTCFYQGSDYRILRYARVVKYRAVLARTGQVIVTDEIRAPAGDCPSSVTSAGGERNEYGNLGNYPTVAEAVEREVSALVASGALVPSGTPSR